MAGRGIGLVRSARGFLAGFGTSGSLLAVAVLLFVVASAMVGFRGWPHVGAQPSPGEVVVSPRATAAASSPSSRRLALFSVATAARVGPGAVTGRHGAAGGGIGRGGTAGPAHSLGRPVTASIPVGTQGSGGGASSCGGGCGSASAPTPAPNPGPIPAQPVQQAVKQTTGALGQVVSGTGNQVGSAVQKTTGAVAGAVEPESPPAAGAVNSVGSGAAKTVTGVTQTVAGALSGLTKH